jgi:hypothetical protein
MGIDSSSIDAETIERFAAICAAIDEGRPRAHVVALAGYDDEAWDALVAAIFTLLASGGAGDLAILFSREYARARLDARRRAASAAAGHTAEMPVYRGDRALPFADVHHHGEVNLTVEISRALLARPVTPFEPRRAPPADETLALDSAAVARRPVLPFAERSPWVGYGNETIAVSEAPPPSGPVLPFSEPPPTRRLQRFDPSTGQPVAEPVWVEEPERPPRR